MATLRMEAGAGSRAHCALVLPIVRMTQPARTNRRSSRNNTGASWLIPEPHGLKAGGMHRVVIDEHPDVDQHHLTSGYTSVWY